MLLALEENPQADESCFQSLAQVVDRIVFNEISLTSGALDGLGGLVRPEIDDLASSLATLALALSEAEPDRGSMQVLLTGYPKWLRDVSDVGRLHFQRILPNIAVHLKELAAGEVQNAPDPACFNTCASAEDCEIVSGCVARYQETSGKIIVAAAEIASVAVRANARPLVEKLMAAVSPEAMFDSKPSRELLPALAKLKTAQAIGVCVAVARENHSSAVNLARRIDEGSIGYLNLFQRIIEEVGVSMVGYGTKQLPALFHTAGEERTARFVDEGIAIAHRYGRVAAEEYLEQNTVAANGALPLG